MRVEELHDLLHRSGVPEDAYVLEPAQVGQRSIDNVYVLDTDGRQWRVYYSERGLRIEDRRFPTEEEACAEMLRRLSREFPIEGAGQVQPWPKWVRYPFIAVVAAVVVYGLVSLVRTGPTPASTAGFRTALSIGVAGLVATMIRVAVGWRQAQRNRSAQPPSGHGTTGADRDRILSQEMDRRLALSDTSVRATYAEARDLSAALRDAGHPEWSRRIDDTLAGGTAHEILMALSWTLSDLVLPSWDDRPEPAPDLPDDLRHRVLSLRAEISVLLGMDRPGGQGEPRPPRDRRVPGFDAYRDNLASPLDRRLAAQGVRHVYEQARTLRDLLRRVGQSEWEQRIDDVLTAGGTASEFLVGLKSVLVELEEAPRLDDDLHGRVVLLLSDIDGLLGNK